MNSSMSIHSTFVILDSLDISSSYILPVFMIGTLTYCAILFFNITLLLTIALNQKLHKPMYILLFNLPINDILGTTAFFPQIMSTVLSHNRSISYLACYVQTFLINLYGNGSVLILSLMAYDRYAAICCPLKYNNLISPNNVLKLIITIWLVDFIINASLIGLSYRQELCSNRIAEVFCYNPVLLKLMCGDNSLINFYGLFLTALFQCVILSIMSFTYIQILIICLSKTQSDTKSKAIQTCGTHLLVFLCFEFSVLFAVMSQRFTYASQYVRRFFSVSVMIFPPFLNPLIYGLKTKEIRQTITQFFRKRIFHS